MLKIFCKSIPAHFPLLTASVHPFPHHSYGEFIEPCNTIIVLTNSIILKVSTQLCCQDFPPFLGFNLIPYRLKPRIHFFTFCGVFLAAGLAANFEVAFSRFVTIVSKTQKIERIHSPILSFSVFPFKSSETYIPAFCRM